MRGDSLIETYEFMGERIEIAVDSAASGGRYAILLEQSPPGGGPPPHIHENATETLVALGGEVEVFLEGNWTKLPQGCSKVIEPGTIHTFRNAGSSTSELLIHFSPGGFEQFFLLVKNSAGNEIDRLKRAAAQVHTVFLPPASA